MKPLVEIDVASVATAERLHELLSAKLGFPDYYGHNWDAFDECISDTDLVLPERVKVYGMDALAEVLPRDAALFRECASRPDAIPAFEWDS